MQEETKSVAKRNIAPPAEPLSQENQLLAMVMEKGNIETLERFIKLRDEQEQRQAMKNFDQHFAALRADLPVMPRSKNGYGYKYCPLEVMQMLIDPVVSEHGFSYRFSEEMLEKPEGWKRVYCHITGYGFERTNSFDVPPMKGTDRMNEVQKLAVLSSYGQRYALKAGFALVVADEDMDGVAAVPGTTEPVDDDEQLAALIERAKAAGMKKPELAEIRERYNSNKQNAKALAAALKLINSVIAEKAERKAGPKFEA